MMSEGLLVRRPQQSPRTAGKGLFGSVEVVVTALSEIIPTSGNSRFL